MMNQWTFFNQLEQTVKSKLRNHKINSHTECYNIVLSLLHDTEEMLPWWSLSQRCKIIREDYIYIKNTYEEKLDVFKPIGCPYSAIHTLFSNDTFYGKFLPIENVMTVYKPRSTILYRYWAMYGKIYNKSQHQYTSGNLPRDKFIIDILEKECWN